MRIPRLREWREARGLIQDELGEEAQVSKFSIVRAEHGANTRPDTARKLANALGVDVIDLMEQPPVPAGKADAPEAGPADQRSEETEAGQSDVDSPLEEERQVIPQSADALKGLIKVMKGLKELREAQIEEIKKGTGPHDGALLIQMEMADKGFRTLLEETGALGFAEAVKAGHEMAHPEAIPLCHQLLRRLTELEALSDEARVSGFAASSNIHEEVVRGISQVESWMQEESERREP